MSEMKHLLDEVLAEPMGCPSGRADSVLERTLHEVRRHQVRRRRRLVAIPAAMAAIIVSSGWIQRKEVLPRAEPTESQLVSSAPLPAVAFVSNPNEPTPTIQTRSEGIELLTTAPYSEPPEPVTDDELLNFARREVAALVRRSNGRTELIMLAGNGAAFDARRHAEKLIH